MSSVNQTTKNMSVCAAEQIITVAKALNTFRGPQGIQGEPGPQGEQGPKGDPGPAGPSYSLPVASAESLGGVQPAEKTDDMTKPVGVDALGGLWTAPHKDAYELIRSVEITEDGTSDVRLEGFQLDRVVMFVTVPAGTQVRTGGIEIYKGSSLACYAYVSTAVNTYDMVIRFDARNEGLFSTCELTSGSGANASNAVQTRALNRSAGYVEGTTPYTRVMFYLSGGASMPIGTAIQLYGVKANA